MSTMSALNKQNTSRRMDSTLISVCTQMKGRGRSFYEAKKYFDMCSLPSTRRLIIEEIFKEEALDFEIEDRASMIRWLF